MHVVEIHHGSEELAAPLSQMRTWLDGKRIEPSAFQLSIIPRGMLFRLTFRERSQATAFAHAFHGRIMVETNDQTLAA